MLPSTGVAPSFAVRFQGCSREVEIGFGRDGKELSFLLRKHAEVFVHMFQRDAVSATDEMRVCEEL